MKDLYKIRVILFLRLCAHALGAHRVRGPCVGDPVLTPLWTPLLTSRQTPAVGLA